MKMKIAFSIFMLLGVVSTNMGCAKKPTATTQKSTTPSKVNEVTTFSVYVASGSVYAGLGITPAAAAQTIVEYDKDGNFVKILRDYVASPGDTPVGLADYNQNYLIALVENTGSRRVELIAKDGSGYSTLFANAALNGVLRAFAFDFSGGLIISKSTAIEKFTTTGTRIQMGANSYVQAPGGACATSTNLFSDVAIAPDQSMILSHAFTAASTNNKIIMINKDGYSIAGDCLATLAAPTTNHFPTAMLMHSSGSLLIAYSNNTGPIFQIYSSAITPATFGTPVLALSNVSLSQAVSKMIELPDGSVLVANAHANFNNVDRYTFDAATGVLTFANSFIKPSVFSRSISGIVAVEKSEPVN